MGYYGKYNMSKKAVDIDLVKIEPIYQGMKMPEEFEGTSSTTAATVDNGNE